MSKLKLVIAAGAAAFAVGLGLLVIHLFTSDDANLLLVLGAASVAAGLVGLVLAVIVDLRSVQHSHDLLRRRTLRMSEIATEQRATTLSVSSRLEALDRKLTVELDKRQLEWFEAAEVLEKQLGHISTRLAVAMERIEQLDGDVGRDLLTRARQIEAVTRICTALPLRRPLPPFGDWAVAPDLAFQLLELVFNERPSLVVEAGSGLSTVLMGYALEMNGSGRLIALEHDEHYWNETADRVRSHGLEGLVEVIHAPLVEVSLGGQDYSWYSTDGVQFPVGIDLLVVDGPPAATNPQARYPAMPLLKDQLSERAHIVLDDTHRPDERAIVDRWLSETHGWNAQELPLERGAILLGRSS